MKEEKILENWPLVGNSHISRFLYKSIVSGKVGGTYIFNGPDDLGKATVAYHFAKSLMCEDKENFPCDKCASCLQFKGGIAHSDFNIIKKEPDKKNISVEQVRAFINSLGMTSFLDSYKIGIIKDADSLSLEASNALLKTLEEPRKNVIIILITTNLESLPKTIVSRSQVINFRPVKSEVIYDYLIKKHKATRSAAKNLSRLCLGRPALAVKFLENKDFYENYLEIVSIFLNSFDKDINDRINDIEKLIGSGQKQETTKVSMKIIGIWQGVVRDMILSSLNHQDLVQHEIRKTEIEKIQSRLKLSSLMSINKLLQDSIVFLKTNVNPKLVLENIVINI